MFVTGTDTSVGKTFVSRGVVRALQQRGMRVVGLKPIETGCTPEPADALALARACGRPALARDPAFYRVAPPLAPFAATLAHATSAPDLAAIAKRTLELAESADFTLVEGAGGLLVPLDATHSMAELAQQLGFPLVLVAPDRLGVLSQVLSAYESAVLRRLPVLALILTRHFAAASDTSPATNASILSARLGVPVFVFPRAADDDDALAAVTESTGIPDLLLSVRV